MTFVIRRFLSLKTTSTVYRYTCAVCTCFINLLTQQSTLIDFNGATRPLIVIFEESATSWTRCTGAHLFDIVHVHSSFPYSLRSKHRVQHNKFVAITLSATDSKSLYLNFAPPRAQNAHHFGIVSSRITRVRAVAGGDYYCADHPLHRAGTHALP